MVQCEVIHLVSRVLNSPQDKYLHRQWRTRGRKKTKRWSTEAGVILFMLATTFLISPQCCLAFWCCDCSRPAWSQAVVLGSRNMWGSFSVTPQESDTTSPAVPWALPISVLPLFHFLYLRSDFCSLTLIIFLLSSYFCYKPFTATLIIITTQ